MTDVSRISQADRNDSELCSITLFIYEIHFDVDRCARFSMSVRARSSDSVSPRASACVDVNPVENKAP